MTSTRRLSGSWDSDHGACPLCGQDLLPREGTFGSFLGCSGYPGCTFTRELGDRRDEDGHEAGSYGWAGRDGDGHWR